MEYRTLGSTALRVSAVAFGAGPVSQLLVGGERRQQLATIARALEQGINWFDTAATYGAGQSESGLGAALAELRAGDCVHVASKVRLMGDDLSDIPAAVKRSVTGTLERLQRPRITLLQIHNSITAEAGAMPTSITPTHVLTPGGVLDAMRSLQQAGLIEHVGLTALGEPQALAEVIASGAFACVQVPYQLLNPSAGRDVDANFAEENHGNVIATCQRHGMGAFAIRVLAGGALAGQPPSPHTFKTPFFPLDLYRRDEQRAQCLTAVLPPGVSLKEAAVRFSLSHEGVASAIVGLGSPGQVDEITRYAAAGPLDAALVARFNEDLATFTPVQP